MRFSERYGHKPVRLELQKSDINEPLKIALVNVMHDLWDDLEKYQNENSDSFIGIDRNIAKAYFQKFCGEIYASDDYSVKFRYGTWFDAMPGYFQEQEEWYRKYDFIEFLCKELKLAQCKEAFIVNCNQALKDHMSAYRIIDNRVVSIIEDLEIEEVNQAVEAAGKFSGASEHIKKAIGFFSDKKNPDYKNVVKEAVTAVESICRIIIEEEKDLGKALYLLEKKFGLHPKLKSSIEKLYNYSCDVGARHANPIEPKETDKVDEAEARFILVTTSAFINYVDSKIAAGDVAC